MAKELVSQDPAMQRALKGLVEESIKVALYTMKHGSMPEKMALMKNLTPHMLEALRTTQKSEADQAQKDAYEQIRKMCRGDE